MVSVCTRRWSQIILKDHNWKAFATKRDTLVFDEHQSIIGMYTPVTKKLWETRYAAEKEPSQQPQTNFYPKPPRRTVISYPFSTDDTLQEHYRNPWGNVRIGRVLEDLDSLAGYVAYQHCDDEDHLTRRPLLVTASVESIRLHNHQLTLKKDMVASGKVVWTGRTSLDLALDVSQDGVSQIDALFTFVARDPVSNKPHSINPLKPEISDDKEVFCTRQRAADARKKLAIMESIGQQRNDLTPEQKAFAQSLLDAARTLKDLPALSDPMTLLSSQTQRENTVIAFPQNRNMHGRIFGGFLLRQAFELAHSTAYLVAGTRPRTEVIDKITFKQPVNVGDLMRFRSSVLHACQDSQDLSKGIAYIQVEAIVTQPEKLLSNITNTFRFKHSFGLKQRSDGGYIVPRMIVPDTESGVLEAVKAVYNLR